MLLAAMYMRLFTKGKGCLSVAGLSEDDYMKSTHLILILLIIVVSCAVQSIACGQMNKQSRDVVIFAVSPQGNDLASGTPAHPFRTLERVQLAVRQMSSHHDVIVELQDGIYRLERTLRFDCRQGGRNGHRVLWTAAPNAHPVISGAIRVRGWKLWDKRRGIYVARTPVGLDARQIWINGQLAHRGAIEIPRSLVTFTLRGIVIKSN